VRGFLCPFRLVDESLSRAVLTTCTSRQIRRADPERGQRPALT